MADKTIEFETKGVKKASDELREVADAAGDATGELKKGEAQTKSSGASAVGLAKKLGALGIAFGTLKAVVVDSTRQFASQQAAVGRLERSFSNAADKSANFSGVLQELRDRSTDLGVSYQEQVDGLSQLVDQTGSITTAQQDLSLALDIAAQENIDLAAAVEILRKVRNGEVEEVKNLDGINKDLAASLGKIEDASRRADQTIAALSNTYEGAAEETKGLQNDLDSLGAASDRLSAAVGRIVTALGGGALGLIGSVLDFTGILSEGEQTLENVVQAFETLAFAVENIDTDQILELAGALGFTVATGGAGAPLLVAAVSDVADELKRAEKNAKVIEDLQKRFGTPGSFGGGLRTEEVPEPEAPPKKKKKKKEKKPPRAKKTPEERTDLEGFGGEFQAAQDAQVEATKREAARLDQQALFAQQFVQIERDKAAEIIAINDELDAEKERLAQNEQSRLEAEKAARAASVSDAATIAGAATGITDTIVKNEAARAAIKSAVELGLGFASLAIPDPVGATLHFAAAAQLTAAAALGGGGGGGGGGSKLAGGSSRQTRSEGKASGQGGRFAKGTTSSAGSTGGARDNRSDLTLLGENARGASGKDRGLTVVFESAFPPGPETRRALRRAQALDMESDA